VSAIILAQMHRFEPPQLLPAVVEDAWQRRSEPFQIRPHAA
jgi:hypothetical protein